MTLSRDKVPQKFGFYAVLTNPLLGFEKLTEVLVEQKVAFIQLRIKEPNINCPRRRFEINKDKDLLTLESRNWKLETANNLRSITKGSKSKFIINDDPFLAMEVDADGVHVGQEDMPYLEVRRLVGSDMIVGLSTHNVSQVKKANKLKPDYIGMGPVYKTPTKTVADPSIGLSGLSEMISCNSLPFVAIGGINLSNVKDVCLAGAKNICAVRLIDQCRTVSEVKEVLLFISSLFC